MGSKIRPILASTLLEVSKASTSSETDQSTGSAYAAIDEALRGGVSAGRMSCISGERGTGKTLIALHVLVTRLLTRPTSQVAVIDTTGSFDVLRLHHIIKLRLQACRATDRVLELANPNPQIFNRPDANDDWDELADAALDRVRIMRVFDFVGVSEAINELRDDIKAVRLQEHKDPPTVVAMPTQITHVDDSESEEEDLMLFDGANDEFLQEKSETKKVEPVSIVIIDNITHVVNPIIKNDYTQGQSLLTSFLRSLSHFTKAEHLTTILLNNANSPRTPIFAPAANPSHLPPSTYIPDPSAQIPSFADQPSIFASTSVRPALGKPFSAAMDLHVLLNQIPKRKKDAEILIGGRSGKAETANIMEVLSDREGARLGRWATFVVSKGLELKPAF